MKPSFSTTKVLITVMTYPHPSETHQELVCTAGITESGEWVRLYPIDYRYRPENQQFHKYQWIEIGLADHGAGNDHRRESRTPDLDSIRLLGEPLSTKNNWLARREIIDALLQNKGFNWKPYIRARKFPWASFGPAKFSTSK